MNANGLAKDLVSFFKNARHLWGRCPNCDAVFRLSDAAISSSQEAPRDWLRRLERQQAEVDEREGNVGIREDDVAERERTAITFERDLRHREQRIEEDARRRVREILGSKTEVQQVIREATKTAVQRSRSALLGRLLERIAPCFRRFGYDPRDMRCICDPMDYVLFDGLTVERRVRKITFIEVKCGLSRLSAAQRSIREAIEDGRVDSEIWPIGDPNISIDRQLSSASRRALPPPRE